MQFTLRPIAPREAKLGRLAAAALSSSVLLLGAFLSLSFASISRLWPVALIGAAVFAGYLVQVHYLSTIGRHASGRRLRTWQFSLAAHFIVFALAYLIVQDSVVFVLLLPEAASAVVHLFGIYHASKAQDGA